MAFHKLKALKNFGEREAAVVSDVIKKGDVFSVNDEQARSLMAFESAERATDDEPEEKAEKPHKALGVPRQESADK